MAKINKYHKVKLNKNSIIAIILLVIIAVVAIILVIPSEKVRIMNDYITVNTETGKETKVLEKDHLYNKVKPKVAVDLIKKGDQIMLYYGQGSCVACVDLVGKLNTSVKNHKNELNVDEIYYIDASDYTVKELESAFSDFDLNFNETPQVYVFNNGKLTHDYQGTQTGDVLGFNGNLQKLINRLIFEKKETN